MATVIELTLIPNQAAVGIDYDYEGDDLIVVYRYLPSRSPELVRYEQGVDGFPIPPNIDYEAPLGVTVGYAAIGYADTDPTPSAPRYPQASILVETQEPTEMWLKNPGRPTLNTRIRQVKTLPKRQYKSQSGLFLPISSKKPKSVSEPIRWWAGSVEFLTRSVSQRERIEMLIEDGDPLLLQTPPFYGGINEYIQVSSVDSGHLAIVFDETFTWSISFDTIAAPPGYAVVASSFTYQQLYDTGFNYLDVYETYESYDALTRDERS